MRTEIKIGHIIDQVKALTKGMSGQEMEQFRDEFIAWLLFRDNFLENSDQNTNHDNLKGLTEKEKALILKLASQTNALYRISREGDRDSD
jgi:hypothetical protein